ncbi:hypothetical protein TRFO_10739 [Tritrichomonas foetus]|uniref:Guanylate cyclase domain-containing protein n=1 Tax=Tritrichomonas foetus TaxID=1144522 RepID=A0A1J4JCM3_9EUKA|nr:hypothetical protein TRFO_10739 [Tritrichomonas foetus]|eukprot:OHS95028.1 hypothetical protein TRFO_10739 [Tritrichomonas foetus]
MESSTISVNSTASGSDIKTLPFLRKSLGHRIKLNFWQFFAYAYASFPIFPFLKTVVYFIRLIQMATPALCPGNKILYPKGTTIYIVMRILSICHQFIPIDCPLIYYRVVGWLFLIIYVIQIIIFLYSSYYFSKNSELPKALLYFIDIFFIMLNQIFTPIAIGCVTTLMIHGSFQIDDLILSIGTYFLFLVMIIIYILINTVSIFFFPIPFTTVRQFPHSILNSLIPILSGLSVIESTQKMPFIMNIVFLLCYILIFCSVYFFGRLIQSLEVNSFISTIITSIVISISLCIFNILKKEVPLYLPLILIVVWFLSYFVSARIQNKLMIDAIITLDQVERDTSKFDQIKASHIFIKMVTYGFLNAHPYCLTFHIFKDAFDQYPENSIILILFAKFISIYPEETHQLSWIILNLKKSKCRKYIYKYVSIQANSILMRRDNTLSPELKKKIRVISQLISTAKNRIKTSWESAVNGDSLSLLPLFEKATILIEQINLKFLNIRSYYSINHHALLLQAMYAKDVLADYQEYEKLRELAKLAQIGRLPSIDQPCIYGRLYFPKLPQKLNVSQTNLVNYEQASPGINDEIITDDFPTDLSTDSLSVHAQIKSSIETLTIPSIRYSILFIIITIGIALIGIFITLLAMQSFLSALISDPSLYLTVISQIRSKALIVCILCVRYRIELINKIEPLCYPDSSIPVDLGGNCNTKDQLSYLTNIAISSLDSHYIFSLSSPSNKYLAFAQNLLYTDQITFIEYDSWNSSRAVNRTLFDELLIILHTLLTIANEDEASIETESRHFAIVIGNSPIISKYLLEISDNLMAFLNSQTDSTKNLIYIIQIVTMILIPLINIIITIFFSRWIISSQKKIYGCFTALPRSTLKEMIQKVDMSENHCINISQQLSQLLSSEELIERKTSDEKIYATFQTANHGTKNQFVFMFVILCIIVSIIESLFIYFSFNLYTSGANSYMKSTPHIETIVSSIVDALTSALTLAIYSDREHFPSDVVESMNNTFNSVYQGSLKKFRILYFGNSTENSDPIVITTKTVFKSLLKEPHYPENLSSVQELYTSLPYDLMYLYAMEMMKKLYSTTVEINETLNPNDGNLKDIWNIFYVHFYPGFVKKLYWSFAGTVSELITDKVAICYSITSMLVVIGIIFGFLAIYALLTLKGTLLSALKLLLHAPPQIVIQSQYITEILSGQYNLKERNISSLDDYYFYKVLSNFPHGLAKLDSEGNIIMINKTGQYLLNDISKLDFVDDKPHLINLNEKSLCINFIILNNHTFACIQDKTIETSLNNQIHEEHHHRDKLISMIIPESILAVHKDPTRSNTIAFQSKNSTVMAILIESENEFTHYSDLFKYIKEAQHKYDKIDYVDIDFNVFIAISGLLDDTCNEISANQIIDFALDISSYIKTLSEYKKNEMILKIGIITGGPINGGVLVMNKIPSLEIFGDVIDFTKSFVKVAPNNGIILSRSTYEYIFNSTYDVRELGEIEVTYIGSMFVYYIPI